MSREESKPGHEVAGQERDGQGETSNFIVIITIVSSPNDIFFFLEREEGRERNIDERETHQLVASSMGPDWELNQQPGYVS